MANGQASLVTVTRRTAACFVECSAHEASAAAEIAATRTTAKYPNVLRNGGRNTLSDDARQLLSHLRLISASSGDVRQLLFLFSVFLCLCNGFIL